MTIKKLKASAHGFVRLLFNIEKQKLTFYLNGNFFKIFLGVCFSSLTRYKQGESEINTHRIHILIINIYFAVLTEDLRYIAL